MPNRSVTIPDSPTPSAPRATSTAQPPRTGGVGGGSGEGPERPVFRHSFNASDPATRSVLLDLVAELADAGLGAEDLSNAELVLAEVLNNIAEHAYADGTGPVELRVEVLRGGLSCMVSDRGRPLPSGAVPRRKLHLSTALEDLPEGGFGWHIILCLTSDMAYYSDGGWNRLSMRIPWAS